MRPIGRIGPILLLALLPACRPSPQASAVPSPPHEVRAYTQFSPGDTLELVQIQLNLNQYAVRFRTGMPEGIMGMVYFLDDGNLHVDARKIGDTWVIVSVPLLEPSDLSAADRLAAWDTGSDPQNHAGKK